MGGKYMARWIGPVILFGVLGIAEAQDIKAIGQEYARHIKSAEAIGALGNDLFGDLTNLYTGTTEFAVTDVSLPGNSVLPIAISRRFQVQPRDGVLSKGNFADWELDMPYLYGIFDRNNSSVVVGWQVDTSTPDARCSVADRYSAAPPEAPADGANAGNYFTAEEYWSGNSLHLPGGGDQEMLVLTSANAYRPTDGTTYRWVTSGQWFFSCLSATANGIVGEAFLARSPEGLIYRFDYVTRRPASSLQKPLAGSGLMLQSAKGGGPDIQPMASNEANLQREEIRILPTRIEDRFGNWVAYTYDANNPGRLTKIQANDGRQLDLTYNASGYIATVTAGTRTWAYAYSGSGTNIGLSSVTLPDGSAWSLNMVDVRSANIQYNSEYATCESPGTLMGHAGTATMTHPSGAVGTFTFDIQRHGRSYVDKFCMYSGTGYSGPYAQYPQTFDVVALASKQISGPGLAAATWSYSYGPANASWDEDCPTPTSCPRTRTVTVTGPEDWVRHTFGNKWADDEGKLLKVERGASASSILRVENRTYQLNASGQLYPALIGESPNLRGDGTGQRHAPVKQTVVTQQSRTFTWQVAATCGSNGTTLCFDQFARPTKVVKSSAAAP